MRALPPPYDGHSCPSKRRCKTKMAGNVVNGLADGLAGDGEDTAFSRVRLDAPNRPENAMVRQDAPYSYGEDLAAAVGVDGHGVDGQECPSYVVARFLLFVLLLTSVSLVQFCLPRVGYADQVEQTEQFLEGLRSRRLFTLAETYCERQLGRKDLSPEVEAALATGWMETLAYHALFATGEQQLQLFKQAEQVAADFRRDHRDHPRSELIDVQEALVKLTEAVFYRQQSQLSTNAAEKKEQARRAFSDAVRQLEDLQKTIDRELPLRRSRHQEGQLTAGELFALRNNLSLHLARASRELAALYPAGSDDWLAALAVAAEYLQDPLTKLPPEDPLTAKLWLEKARISRTAGNLEEASKALKLAQPASPTVVQEKKLEEVELALATADFAAADKLLTTDLLRQRGDAAVLKLNLLLLQSEAERKGDDAVAKAWRDKATQLVKEIEQLHGNYWGRLAEQQLLASVGPGETADLELMARSADDLFRKKQYEQAVAAYQQAAAQAASQGANDTAMLMEMRAAAVLQSQAKHKEAADILADAASRYADDPRAPQSQLMAAWNLAKILPQQADLLADYEQALQTSRKSWPDAASTQQARVWLVRLLAGQKKWQEVINVGLELPRESELWQQASPTVDLALETVLSESTDADRASSAAELVKQIEAGLPDANSSDRFAAGDAELAITAAKLHLAAGPENFDLAEKWLTAAGPRLSELSETWQTEAAVAGIIVAAAGPNSATSAEQAKKTLQGLSLESRSKLWLLIEKLASVREIAASANATNAAAIAKLELAAIEMLKTKPATRDASPLEWQVELAEADAHAAAGDRTAADQLFQQTLKEQPNLSQPQVAYARFLASGDAKADQEAALARWRTIAARTPPQTDAWYEAKHEVARMLLATGDKQRAGELIRYLKVSDPTLADSAWARKFDLLLRKTQ